MQNISKSYAHWKSLKGSGEVSAAISAAQEYLEQLIDQKNFSAGLLFLDELKGSGLDQAHEIIARLIFLAIKGDHKAIDLLWSNPRIVFAAFGGFWNISSKNIDHYLKQQVKWQKIDHTKNLRPFLELNVAIYLYHLRQNHTKIEIKKELIHTLHDLMLFFPNAQSIPFFLMEYSMLSKRKNLLQRALQLQSSVIPFFPDRLFRGNMQSMAQKAQQLIPSLREEVAIDTPDEGFDFATDLFKNTSQSPTPDDTSPQDGPSPANQRGIQEIEQELKNEFNKIGLTLNAENVGGTQHLRLPDFLDRKTIINHYQDVAVALSMLGQNTQAIQLLEWVETEREPDSWHWALAMEYLCITFLMETHNFQEAFTRGEYALTRIPLLPDEKICFLYLTAECLYALDKRADALSRYKSISELDPHYRLTKERVESIETHK